MKGQNVADLIQIDYKIVACSNIVKYL